MNLKRDKVVVTGLGCLTALGLGAGRFWQAMLEARSAIKPITRFDTSTYRTRIGGEVQADMSALLNEINLVGLSRSAQFAVAAAHDAIRDAGLEGDQSRLSTAGIVMGSGLGGIYFGEEALTALQAKGPRAVSPLLVPCVDPNGIVNHVARHWQMMGPQFTVSTACSSSAHALGLALDMIRCGRATMVLAGGVEVTISPLVFAGFDRLRAMSSRNASPETACRPFSADRDGFVMAEGAAMLMLESEFSANERGAKIYAEVQGYGATGGAHHAVMPRPDGSDLVDAMKRALTDAGLAPDCIDLINPHGTGTKLNDDAELLALQTVFGKRLHQISVTPTKQLTGHLLGAAGALESLHLVKSISEQFVSPIQLISQGPELDIPVGSGKSRTIRAAMNNSFGFGNNNVSLIFGKNQ